MMRTIYFHGEMAKHYGREFKLDVFSLQEVIRALSVQIKGLHMYLELRDFQIIRGNPRDEDYMEDREIYLGLGNTEELHILPVIKGAGGDNMSLGKIIAGVLLAGFAFWAAPALQLTQIAGMSMKSIGMVGVGLIFSGVSQMLSPQPKDEKDDSSSTFSNIPGVAEQGGCVPVIIGRIRVDNMPVISARIITKRVAIDSDD